MSSHHAKIEWERSGARFTDNQYSRAHQWSFDGGAIVPASSSPDVVKVPLSNPANVDPEEGYVASLSSCHMLWFLDIARRAGFVVDRYVDEAVGHMMRGADGMPWIANVKLQPAVDFSGDKAPYDAAVTQLHHMAHEACFLARSVKTEIAVAGTWTYRQA